jgi:general secretion pathway protein I
VNRKGFTLVEVLVALAILTIALSGLMQVFSTGMRATVAAEKRTVAVLLARSRLAAIGIEEPLRVGESNGEWDDGYRWSAVVTAEETAPGQNPHHVSVTVSWGEAGRGGAVTLDGLALPEVERGGA